MDSTLMHQSDLPNSFNPLLHTVRGDSMEMYLTRCLHHGEMQLGLPIALKIKFKILAWPSLGLVLTFFLFPFLHSPATVQWAPWCPPHSLCFVVYADLHILTCKQVNTHRLVN
jgi:hypothetical protein